MIERSPVQILLRNGYAITSDKLVVHILVPVTKQYNLVQAYKLEDNGRLWNKWSLICITPDHEIEVRTAPICYRAVTGQCRLGLTYLLLTQTRLTCIHVLQSCDRAMPTGSHLHAFHSDETHLYSFTLCHLQVELSVPQLTKITTCPKSS